MTNTPTDVAALERPAVTSDCNEALSAARVALMAVRRLALVAQNALLNGDLYRVCSILQDLQDATSSDDNGGATTVHAVRPLKLDVAAVVSKRFSLAQFLSKL